MAMKVIALVDGTRRADFFDKYGDACSIEEHGFEGDRQLLLGVNGDRMQLDRNRAAELLPLLLSFVETGRLPGPPEKDPTW